MNAAASDQLIELAFWLDVAVNLLTDSQLDAKMRDGSTPRLRIEPTRAALASSAADPSPGELASMLYRLQFPRKHLHDQPASVQAAYCYDAVRLLAMMKGEE